MHFHPMLNSLGLLLNAPQRIGAPHVTKSSFEGMGLILFSAGVSPGWGAGDSRVPRVSGLWASLERSGLNLGLGLAPHSLSCIRPHPHSSAKATQGVMAKQGLKTHLSQDLGMAPITKLPGGGTWPVAPVSSSPRGNQ